MVESDAERITPRAKTGTGLELDPDDIYDCGLPTRTHNLVNILDFLILQYDLVARNLTFSV